MKEQRNNIERRVVAKYENKLYLNDLKYQQELDKLQRNINSISHDLELKKQKLKNNFSDIKNEMYKVILNPNYFNCKLTDDSMRFAEEARHVANAGKFAD